MPRSSICLVTFILVSIGAIVLLWEGSYNIEESYYVTQHSHLNFDFEQSDIAICLMVKDDTDIVEWITYHNRIGVNKFYVFDNMSKPPLESLLKPFIDNKLVTYEYSYGGEMPWYQKFINRFITEWRADSNKQVYINDMCAKKYMNKHKWLGYLDTDEFVRFLPHEATSSNAIPEYSSLINALADTDPSCAGVQLPWMLFGSSGFLQRPKGGVLGHYSKCYPGNMVKSFSLTKFVTGHSLIHDMEYKPGNISCRSKKLRIDHYAIKSREDYENKMIRGSGNSVKRNMQYFEDCDHKATQDCDILFMPPKGLHTV